MNLAAFIPLIIITWLLALSLARPHPSLLPLFILNPYPPTDPESAGVYPVP